MKRKKVLYIPPKIRTFKRDNYEMTHERYLNSIGFEVEYFWFKDLIKRFCFPFHGPRKITNNYIKISAINRIEYKYTDKEYMEIFEEAINNYKKHYGHKH